MARVVQSRPAWLLPSLRRVSVVIPVESGFRIESGASTHLIEREDGVALRAGWPALVVSAQVECGDVVAAGDPIAVLESMKMETTITAPMAGEIVAVSIMANAQVERGAPIVRIRPVREPV